MRNYEREFQSNNLLHEEYFNTISTLKQQAKIAGDYRSMKILFETDKRISDYINIWR